MTQLYVYIHSLPPSRPHPNPTPIPPQSHPTPLGHQAELPMLRSSFPLAICYNTYVSESCWWTGRPGLLQPTGPKRVGHDCMTELNSSVIHEVVYTPEGYSPGLSQPPRPPACIHVSVLYSCPANRYLPIISHAVLNGSLMSDSVTAWAIAHQAPLPTGILQARILEWVAMPSSRDYKL